MVVINAYSNTFCNSRILLGQFLFSISGDNNPNINVSYFFFSNSFESTFMHVIRVAIYFVIRVARKFNLKIKSLNRQVQSIQPNYELHL